MCIFPIYFINFSSFSFPCKLYFLIRGKLFYTVVFVSVAQQCESVIIIYLWHIYIFVIDLLFVYISVQFSHSVMSDFLRLHGLQHTRLPCPSSTPGAYSDSCPLSQWCHPIISFSVIPFSSHLQSFPASGSFPMSHFFASGGQSIGVCVCVCVCVCVYPLHFEPPSLSI